MKHEVRVFFDTHEMSDPLDRFWQVSIRVDRDNGKSLMWRGERIPQPKLYPESKIGEAVAAAVREMLRDRTVLELVGQV